MALLVDGEEVSEVLLQKHPRLGDDMSQSLELRTCLGLPVEEVGESPTQTWNLSKKTYTAVFSG